MKSRAEQKTSGQGKNVGIWIRVSTEDQAKGESPEHHEKRAHYYAESKDSHIREVYHLEAISGKSVMGHPETERMLSHIRSGHITGSRLSGKDPDPGGKRRRSRGEKKVPSQKLLMGSAYGEDFWS
jgi:hypothetical protein